MCSYCCLLERSEGNKLLVLFLIGPCFFLVLFFPKINMWLLTSLAEGKELWLDSFLIVQIIHQHLSFKRAFSKAEPTVGVFLAVVNIRSFWSQNDMKNRITSGHAELEAAMPFL